MQTEARIEAPGTIAGRLLQATAIITMSCDTPAQLQRYQDRVAELSEQVYAGLLTFEESRAIIFQEC